MPVSFGRAPRSLRKASSPPAEAPMPTTGNEPMPPGLSGSSVPGPRRTRASAGAFFRVFFTAAIPLTPSCDCAGVRRLGERDDGSDEHRAFDRLLEQHLKTRAKDLGEVSAPGSRDRGGGWCLGTPIRDDFAHQVVATLTRHREVAEEH